MIAFLGSAATALLLAPAASLFWSRLFAMIGNKRPIGFVPNWIAGAIGGVVGGLIGRDWPWAAGASVSLIVALAVWWWRRKKRRKAAALLGAKARAIRDAMVRKVREATTPRPVLRPVPVPR